ncbi:glycosyltransferase [Burkholderia ambifaria]|uniref:glycosyltransferase n=1 Tax=Burkholderia ambifaria TaxID=152480 RepID=UPI000D00EC04|nr:glycosyltransferase [Burkholderia ambifaria]PRD98004.1 glycosyl transferase family 1 [Burkholderia ambifaria]
MRIVIDMQGAQTESRFRGIGRYSLSLALALARNAGDHEVYLALSGLFPETIGPIREAFRGLVPQERIRVWQAPGPMRWVDANNASRRAVAERVREAFLETLDPDIVVVTSLFEGLGDDAVISIGALGEPLPTAVILYDLIPLINPDEQYRTNPVYRGYYADRIENLKRARHLLAISESARQEALGALPFSPEKVTNVSGACDEMFTRVVPDADSLATLKRRLGVTRPFIMYTGGADARKNLPRLIEAFAHLPDTSRHHHQLLFVGRMPQSEVSALRAHAQRVGLRADELLFSDYISDEELLALFSTCQLFVFPSLHEGFGLPPLEAMACGAVVIAADAASLPEVMGSPEALFDPQSVPAISAKMHQALTDDGLRARLLENARIQAQAFSWDRSAKLVLQAIAPFERTRESRAARPVTFERTTLFEPKINRILLLKLDHMGDLLLAVPAISRLRARYPKATIDIVVGSWNQALAQTLPFFDRVLTLDYFKRKSSLQAELSDGSLTEFVKQLGFYDLAIDFRRQPDTRFVLAQVDAGLKVGYGSLDPAIDAKLDIALPTYQDLPFVETPLNRISISEQMLALVDALPAHPSDYVVLPPIATPLQQHTRAVALFPYAGGDAKEWPVARFHELARRLAADPAVELVSVFFASEKEAQRFSFDGIDKVVIQAGLSIPELMRHLAGHQLCVANNSGGAHMAAYLGVTALGVYGGLETAHEWAPVFGNSYVLHNEAACSPCHIPARRDCPHNFFCLEDITVDEVFARCRELLAQNGAAVPTAPSRPSVKSTRKKLFQALAPLVRQCNEDELAQVAQGIALSLPTRTRRALFVDVSELVSHDARTGIQRVVRSILSELLQDPPKDFEVWPVYSTHDRTGYFYAKRLRSRFMGQGDPGAVQEDPIDFQAGDVFLGLDLNPYGIGVQEPFLDEMSRQGVRIQFVVYDLLCVQMPSYFAPGSEALFDKWLNTISRYDGVVCGSRTVADEFTQWLREHHPQRERALEVGWFHYGADVQNSRPSTGMPSDAPRILKALRAAPSFLMVGTVEPRKGHAQALTAFEQLWQQGTAINLVIVGKSGWLVEKLVARLRAHPELGKRLFWLESISDEYLEQVYGACSCLLAASEGEGFGLPLIEAGRKHLPILARDLPVFREVALSHAHYFHGNSGEALAQAVTYWLELYRQGTHPKSEGMPTLTWQASVQQLLDNVLPTRQVIKVVPRMEVPAETE